MWFIRVITFQFQAFFLEIVTHFKWITGSLVLVIT